MIDQTLAHEITSRHMWNLMAALEPLVPLLENKSLTDIHIYGDGKVKAEHFLDGNVDTGITLAEDARQRIINYLASMNDMSIDTWENPTLESVIPQYNFRLTSVQRPWVQSPEITMRRPAAEIYSLERYLEEGRMSQTGYDLLCESIKNKENIIIGGATGSGKTTFTNACMEKMREYTPADRFLIIEDTPELQSLAENKTILYIRKEQARKAVEFAMRWHPKRIIFGEIRSGIVARELLEGWNTGHKGNLTTIHANSASSILRRLWGMTGKLIIGADLADIIQVCVHLSYKDNFGPVVDEIIPTKQLIKNLHHA
jgi:type IV secretion system protein VirB11